MRGDFISVNGDCNDGDAGINPELPNYNDIDQDCSGSDLTNGDSDGDGDGFTTNQGDCNDDDSAINPDATEICDNKDNDCDGSVDENDASDALTWFQDSDSDTYGGSISQTACSQPNGFVATHRL